MVSVAVEREMVCREGGCFGGVVAADEWVLVQRWRVDAEVDWWMADVVGDEVAAGES